MGIYKAPYQLAYTVSGTKLDTYLNLSAGSYTANVTEWDYCGGAATKAVSFTVSASATANITTAGKTFYNVQASGGWSGHGELPPGYSMCSSCSGLGWSMTRGISSPSMDGKATKYSIYGTRPYADVLWNNHLIGDGSSQGVPDSSHTLVNKLHNFTYDAYFYGSNLALAENIEFDIGQFFNGMQFMFGTQCQVVNGHVWGVWDSAHGHWMEPCSHSVPAHFRQSPAVQIVYVERSHQHAELELWARLRARQLVGRRSQLPVGRKLQHVRLLRVRGQNEHQLLLIHWESKLKAPSKACRLARSFCLEGIGQVREGVESE
jgi:hypothetical protein